MILSFNLSFLLFISLFFLFSRFSLFSPRPRVVGPIYFMKNTDTSIMKNTVDIYISSLLYHFIILFVSFDKKNIGKQKLDEKLGKT